MHLAYSKAIQQELDRTAAVSLPAKLDSFIGREHTRYLTHTLDKIDWETYAKEPYFLPQQKSIFEESVRLFQLLMALRPEFEQIRACLHLFTLPMMNDALAELMAEETLLASLSSLRSGGPETVLLASSSPPTTYLMGARGSFQ